MSLETVGLALGLLLVAEGLLPFVNPAAWRRLFEQVIQLSDKHIRTLGLVSLALGVFVLLLAG